MKKAHETEIVKLGCNLCEENVEECYECDCHLDSEHFWCDGMGEHLCNECINKRSKKD